MDRDDKISYLTNILDASCLPELIQDLGADHLETAHFDSFRQSLDRTLVELFDLIQQNEDLLYDTENDTLQLRCKFLLLLCEQTATGTLYQTKDHNLLDNVTYLCSKHFQKITDADPKLIEAMFAYYKERLRGSTWKRNLGAIHGFEQFCTLYYTTYSHYLNRDLCTFLLSVSLLVEEFYEPTYKEMGYRLMYLILTRTAKDDLQQLNLQHVIYEILFKNIPKSTSHHGTLMIWNCLYECVALMNIADYSKWNKFDDIFEALVRRISFESSTDICVDLILCFPKFCLLNSPKCFDWNEYTSLEDAEKYNEKIIKLRESFRPTLRLKVFHRWARRFLKLLIAESHRLLGNEKTAIQMLYVMNICYIVCISSIPTKVLEKHLLEFFDKFPSVLMEAVATYKKSPAVLKGVSQFIETFKDQLGEDYEQSNYCNDLLAYKNAFDKVLKFNLNQNE